MVGLVITQRQNFTIEEVEGHKPQLPVFRKKLKYNDKDILYYVIKMTFASKVLLPSMKYNNKALLV